MVYQATQAIYDAFKAHDLECGIEARDEFSAVHIGININSTSFEARFISRSENNDVALRIFNLLHLYAFLIGCRITVFNFSGATFLASLR